MKVDVGGPAPLDNSGFLRAATTIRLGGAAEYVALPALALVVALVAF